MKKTSETLVFSTLGVVAMFLILVAVNVIGSRVKARVDLTADHQFTLSAGTKAVLKRLDTPIQIRLYVTQDSNQMPLPLRNYAQEVEDLLSEYQQAAKPNIEVVKLDPKPDSDAEDSANLDGVDGQQLPNGDKLYLGLSFTMLDKKVAIPFLQPGRERLLEYDISRAISQVITDKKPVIGIMSPLPYAGQQANPMMMMQQTQGAPPWTFYTELQRDFDVKTVEATATEIPPEVKTLLVIHPKEFSDPQQYALDQFVLRGGKLIVCVDPFSVFDRPGGGPGTNSTLPKLFEAWGLKFDVGQTIADTDYLANTQQGQLATLLDLNAAAFNKDDVLTSDLDNMLMPYVGTFGFAKGNAPAAGLKETVLIKSSVNSQLVEPAMASMGPAEVIKNFHAGGVELPIAIRLSGKFKTAFPGGKPGEPAPAPTDKNAALKPASLQESATENTVLLVADVDFLQDPVSVSEAMTPFGQRVMVPANGNISFIQSAVEQFSGDSDLIAVRARASAARPFTLVRKMQAAAQSRYQSKIQELEADLSDAEQKLNALQQTKAENGQKYILSPEQQAELTKFRQHEGEVKKELKDVRRSLAEEIDALSTRLQWINIGLMPALVALAGLLFFILKRKRAAAR